MTKINNQIINYYNHKTRGIREKESKFVSKFVSKTTLPRVKDNITTI